MNAEDLEGRPNHVLSSATPSTLLPPPEGLTRFIPIAIPQVSKSSQSEIITPFLRAYSPTLLSYGITQDDFLTFLDGLNEAWIANPVLQATSIAGSVMGMIHPVEIAGIVIETISEAASEGSSYLRTRRYLKKANEEAFGPRGLHVRICGFDEMLDGVGVSGMWARGSLEVRRKGNEREEDVGLEELERLLADANESTLNRQHPRLRLLQALEGYVAPLERVCVPVEAHQPNMLRRWNAYFAAKEEQKRTEEQGKKREGVRKRRAEKYQQAIDEVRRQNTHIERIREKIKKADAERSTHEKETAKKIDRLTAEMGKIEKEKQKRVKRMLRSADAGLEKLEQKEAEDTMKTKWLVISEAGKEKGIASKE